jgi:hypothetical protein
LLQQWARQVRAAGITRIAGDLLIDNQIGSLVKAFEFRDS